MTKNVEKATKNKRIGALNCLDMKVVVINDFV